MRALFITTETADCANHVAAWNSWSAIPAVHQTFHLHGIRNDWRHVEEANKVRPAIIFYIGAWKAPGNPTLSVFTQLREIAPVVHLCSDAADAPWHDELRKYASARVFSLQVAIDGARSAPIDFITLTPVNYKAYLRAPKVPRDIRCGFSGSVGHYTKRSEYVRALEWFGGVTVRLRDDRKGYDSHVNFMHRCKILLNAPWTGTGGTTHIKGRVLEAGWARCALLEHAESPIGFWFEKGSWLSWNHPKEAAEIIAGISDLEIARTANRLAEEVRDKYTPSQIFAEILSRVGSTKPIAVA